jgi:hypothetical protein
VLPVVVGVLHASTATTHGTTTPHKTSAHLHASTAAPTHCHHAPHHHTTQNTCTRACARAATIAEQYPYLAEHGLLELLMPKKEPLFVAKT